VRAFDVLSFPFLPIFNGLSVKSHNTNLQPGMLIYCSVASVWKPRRSRDPSELLRNPSVYSVP
jgi:hypothetical protein